MDEAVTSENATKLDIDLEGPNEAGKDGLETANQFSTLVQASAVDFSSTREVEQLTEGSVKIRLSRGQVFHSVCVQNYS